MWESIFKNPYILRFLNRFPKAQWSKTVECVLLYSVHQLEGVPNLTPESLQSLVRGLTFQTNDSASSLSQRLKTMKAELDQGKASVVKTSRNEDWKLFRKPSKRPKRTTSVPDKAKKPILSLEEIMPGIKNIEASKSETCKQRLESSSKPEYLNSDSKTERTRASSSRDPEPLSPKKLKRKPSSSQLPSFTGASSTQKDRIYPSEESEIISIADQFLSSAVLNSFTSKTHNDSSVLWQESTRISDRDRSFSKKPQAESSFLKLLKIEESVNLDSFEEYLSKRMREKSRALYKCL